MAENPPYPYPPNDPQPAIEAQLPAVEAPAAPPFTAGQETESIALHWQNGWYQGYEAGCIDMRKDLDKRRAGEE